MHWVFVALCRLSLGDEGGYCLVVVHGLLIAMTSLIVEHGLSAGSIIS